MRSSRDLRGPDLWVIVGVLIAVAVLILSGGCTMHFQVPDLGGAMFGPKQELWVTNTTQDPVLVEVGGRSVVVPAGEKTVVRQVFSSYQYVSFVVVARECLSPQTATQGRVVCRPGQTVSAPASMYSDWNNVRIQQFFVRRDDRGNLVIASG
ncbi:MAG TPA: hypothetical protein VJL32_00360 [Candidatus Paceibacterota bacterium]